MNGSGTTSEHQQYQFLDDHPNDINYYRLKQIDFGGPDSNRDTYSDIIVMKLTCDKSRKNKNEIILFPNPVSQNEITLWFNAVTKWRPGY